MCVCGFWVACNQSLWPRGIHKKNRRRLARKIKSKSIKSIINLAGLGKTGQEENHLKFKTRCLRPQFQLFNQETSRHFQSRFAFLPFQLEMQSLDLPSFYLTLTCLVSGRFLPMITLWIHYSMQQNFFRRNLLPKKSWNWKNCRWFVIVWKIFVKLRRPPRAARLASH